MAGSKPIIHPARIICATVVVASFFGVACVREDDKTSTSSVTVGVEHVSAVSAVLKGKATFGKSVAADFQMGFQYSHSAGILPDNSTTVDVKDIDADYNFSTDITGLEPASVYYFRSFVRQNGQDIYGETLEFTTKEITSLFETNEASDIQATSAKLKAKLDLTEVQFSSIAYGFLWGSSESALDTEIKCTSIVDNAFAATLTNLSHKTQYWYKAYAKIDEQTFYGGVKSFTTGIVPVESVSLDKSEYTFDTIGDQLELTATVFPSSATDKSVIWSSDKESVASVDANGKVTANGNGTATIAVTTKDQGEKATCSITVSQKVTGLTLNKSELPLIKGQTEVLVATIIPEDASDKTVTWSSSNNSIATVDKSGKVTAKNGGSAIITARAGEKTATCSVIVTVPVESITLNKTEVTIEKGKSEILIATIDPNDATDKTVTWSSADNNIAEVSQDGKVTAKNGGNVIITASSGDVSAFCSVTVTIPVTNIRLNKSELPLIKGQQEVLTATVEPEEATDKTVSWSSSDESIVSVDQNGQLLAVNAGAAIVTAKSGTKSATCSVTVTIPVESISLNLTEKTIKINETVQLSAEIYPSEATNQTVQWSSSDASIASVRSDGLVRGLKEGQATITASAENKPAICVITVLRSTPGGNEGIGYDE